MQVIARSVFSGAQLGGWRRFFYALRPSPRSRHAKRVADKSLAAEIDPIALTIMAVDRLGPARLRADFYGMPVTVAAPDQKTAEIFRAALSRMAQDRPTDRLISVELIGDRSEQPRTPRARRAS
jgi:hypothetical protein